MKRDLSQFKADATSNCFIHPDHSEFAYSDGTEVEAKILQILKETTDLSSHSEELSNRISDWPTEYHFSPLRHNLLRHIPIERDANVLELGCGCGAISRLLGETGARLTSIEGSLIRARAAAERCRDLPNVQIYCSDFNKVSFAPIYDVVTLIGVLEYAPIFLDSQNPIVDCLLFANNVLKPNGRLIVAIENQLGLKYFCGSTEDHVGRLFFGLEDRYGPRTVRTMGRIDLTNALSGVGFGEIEFHYPFPDYKLPSTIVTDAGFDTPNFLAEELFRFKGARDYANLGTQLIKADSVWPVLTRNQIAQDLANSFLVIAHTKKPQVKTPPFARLLAVVYSEGRVRPYQIKTEFFRNADGEIKVRKSRLYHESPADSARIYHTLAVAEDYVPGLTLHSEIYTEVRRENLSLTIDHLRRWLIHLQQNSLEPCLEFDWDMPLPKDYIDAIPPNLISYEHRLISIDREWVLREPPSAGTLLLRYFCNNYELLLEMADLMKVPSSFERREIEALRRTLIELGAYPSRDAYGTFVAICELIDNAVFPGQRRYRDKDLEDMLEAPLTPTRIKEPDTTNLENSKFNKQSAPKFLHRLKEFFDRHVSWRMRTQGK